MKRETSWAAWIVASGFVGACATAGDGRDVYESDAGAPGAEVDGGDVVADAGRDAKVRDAGPDADPDPDPDPDADADPEPDPAPDADSGTDSGPPLVAEVFGHSPTALYRLDPTTLAVTLIGAFDGLSDAAIDLAVDHAGHGYLTTFNGFYRVDLATAQATLIQNGAFPNSLSFVPIGTVDANVEALVGYNGATYVRIDTTTGAVTTLGSLGDGGFVSSGDVVSVEGGGTYLTVQGGSCADCLVRVDPTSGALLQSYGSVQHAAVYGLGYWAGSLYGFDGAGELFSISFPNGVLTTHAVAVQNGPDAWYGAGSTTAAPVTDVDGGGPPR